MRYIRISPNGTEAKYGQEFVCSSLIEPTVDKVRGRPVRTVFSGTKQTWRDVLVPGRITLVDVSIPNYELLKDWEHKATKLQITSEDGKEVLASNVWLDVGQEVGDSWHFKLNHG